MKWIFLAFMLVLTPVLISQLRANPKAFLVVGFLIGLGPFAISPLHLSVAPISWAGWPGTVQGLEVTILDFIAIAILFVTTPSRTSTSLKVSLAIIMAGFVLSTFAAQGMTPSLFYGWQFVRTALLFFAVARASSAIPSFPTAIISGYAAGLVYLTVTVGTEFGGGDIQAGGAFGHQNFTGMVTMFVVFPAFALLIAGERVKTAILVMACEGVIAFAGGSRATIGLLGLGLVLTLILSMWHRKTGGKSAAAAISAMALAVAAPVMILAIERRPEAARAGSTDERRKFEDAAGMMVRDNPLGVGANQYVITANLGGYSDRAGVPWNTSERSAPVHNAYYLIAAEMGAVGLLGYVSLLGSLILIGLRALRSGVASQSSELLVGLTVTSIITAIFYAFEWVTMTAFIHYFAAINAGLTVGIAYALKRTPKVTRAPKLSQRRLRTPSPSTA